MNIFKLLKFPLIIFFIWALGFCWFLSQIISYEIKIDQKADAIIVLTGAKGRIEAGIKLLEDKKAEHLFISGVGQKALLKELGRHLDKISYEKIEKLEKSISLGHKANSTKENALETAQWLKEHNYKTVILVTSNYHMPRSLYLFQSLIPNLRIIPYSVVKNNISFELAFLEYNKFLLYLFHIQTSGKD